MNAMAHWVSPEVLRALSLALLHFLWQGAALAAIAGIGMALLGSASKRYALGIIVLAGMVIAPAVTFVVLRNSPTGDQQFPRANSPSTMAAQLAIFGQTPGHSSPRPAGTERSYLWLVEAWFLGVFLFSLRTAGGVIVLERLRRSEAAEVNGALLERCLAMQRRMGLDHAVKYCKSIQVDAPAVIGWFRPMMLLPLSALTGLSEAQLEAVIAHELAHIRRYDAFFNLFQIAVESILFYHPAVWWLSKRIRAERENCCDDAAIAVCGSPLEYAKALTMMEQWRVSPAMAMAANRGSLSARVRRMLGKPTLESGMRTAGVAAGVLCLCVAVAAGHALLGVARASATPATTNSKAEKPVRPRSAEFVISARKPSLEENVTQAKPATAPEKPQEAAKAQPAESYIDAMKAAGLTDLSVDDLVAMKIQGITPEYVREVRTAGIKADADELIGMKVQGITPQYIQQMKDLGLQADPDCLIAMKVQGITPEYVREIRAAGIKGDADELIGMKVQGITPEYIQRMKEVGLQTDADSLIGMKVQGITPEYVKSLQAAGFKVDADDCISAKVQGITPEFIEKVRSHGFKNLDLDQVIKLKHSGVLEK
jgi:beta-lactamase regulating signal transducer with metallopeptidase domain